MHKNGISIFGCNTFRRKLVMEQLDSILEGINNREEKSWKQLYAICYKNLCVYAENIINNQEDARDIIQELFINIWYAETRFPTSLELLGYLYKSTRRNSLIFIRNKRYREKILRQIRDEEKNLNDFLQKVICSDVYTLLYTRITQLPPMQRKIIELSITGLSGKEIANTLGISVNTVKVQKSRGIKYLRKYLKNE